MNVITTLPWPWLAEPMIDDDVLVAPEPNFDPPPCPLLLG